MALILSTAGSTHAQVVQRCESADGKVTYSNTRCPEGSSPVRQVNTSPPVAVDEQKAAKERARKEAADAKSIDKAREQEQARLQREAAEQKKVQAKDAQRCANARRDLERAQATRAVMSEQRAATLDQMQKADREIGKREAEVAKACPAA
jgi:hypothetical protein